MTRPLDGDPRLPWYPHVPGVWRQTPGGHTRDGGPFPEVALGLITEDDLDAAVDDAYARFAVNFPDLVVGEYPVTLNSDYTLWEPRTKQWVSGVWYSGSSLIHLSIWRRATANADPGPAFIVRPPGIYWAVYYSQWRYTALPLCPALVHELLHTVIGDPGHTSPLWSQARKPGQEDEDCVSGF